VIGMHLMMRHDGQVIGSGGGGGGMAAGSSSLRVLILGGGDGGALKRVLMHTEVQHVTIVDIDQGVVDAAAQFFGDTVGSALVGWERWVHRLFLRIADSH
jgi:spermidine synthase